MSIGHPDVRTPPLERVTRAVRTPHLQRTFRASGWMYSSRALVFGWALLLTHQFGIAEYGIYAMAFAAGAVYLIMHLLSRKRERDLLSAKSDSTRFRGLTELSAEQADMRSLVTGRVVDSYTNIPTVKLFAHADREDHYAREGMEWMLDTVNRSMRMSTLMTTSLQLL